jgi:hypothetical protein
MIADQLDAGFAGSVAATMQALATPSVGCRAGRRVVYDLYDDHVAHLLDEAVSHAERGRYRRSTPQQRGTDRRLQSRSQRCNHQRRSDSQRDHGRSRSADRRSGHRALHHRADPGGGRFPARRRTEVTLSLPPPTVGHHGQPV